MPQTGWPGGAYQTLDGHWVVFTAPAQHLFERLCTMLGEFGWRRFGLGRSHPLVLNRSNKAVASLGKSLDKTRFLGVIIQGFAQSLDCIVQALVKIHESVRGPDSLLQFSAANYVTRPLKQGQENLKGLNLQFDTETALAQFTGTQVNVEVAETDSLLRCAEGWHIYLFGCLPVLVLDLGRYSCMN